ncbi:MAG TPA: hypothetical protein VF103_03525 [Polyangiaceae bacterium]
MLDGEHLRLLRIGYFISAGYTALFVPFGLVYAGMGVLMSHLPGAGSAAPPALVSWVMGLFGGVFATFAIVGATLKLLAAIRLKERRSRVLCLVAAAFTCLEVPWGTALGVMTFMVLSRPSVRRLFEEHR